MATRRLFVHSEEHPAESRFRVVLHKRDCVLSKNPLQMQDLKKKTKQKVPEGRIDRTPTYGSIWDNILVIISYRGMQKFILKKERVRSVENILLIN